MTVNTHNPVEKRKILDMFSSIIAQVQASGVPENSVQCLVGSMEELVNDIHTHAKEAVVECLSSDASKETLEKVEDCFDQLENTFSCLNTESKTKKNILKKDGKKLNLQNIFLLYNLTCAETKQQVLTRKCLSMISSCMYQSLGLFRQCSGTVNFVTVS